MDVTASTFILSLMKIVFNSVVFIAALGTLGVPMTAFITLITSCGVAIGLALQGSLSNFAGGLMLLIFKPFKVGDYIEAGGYEGKVEGISVLYTVLTTADNRSVTLPNGNLTNNAVVNYNAHTTRRHTFTFSADYSADMDLVKNTIMDVCESDPMVFSDPAPSVGVDTHADSAVTYSVKVWCKSEDYWDVRYSIPEAVKRAFDERGIPIPYPHVQIVEKK
jgi:small conductance mechanosensitive channel